ncbi:MAG: recombinase family protein, partial [Dehalococcoidia bacterium]|nr:recombinase family protein [Dehalococcoidia bacterium]
MKAAIYCRVSTAKQAAEGKSSMDDQLARCQAVCEAKGWEIVEVFDEGDASAGTAHRGEFQRMIADAKAGRFDVIVAREVSRLSRVAQARRAIEELMIEWGVAVCNARNGMVYSESEGLGAGIIWHVEAKMAEAEWAERSFRTTMGMRGKAEKGVVPGSKAPYGYTWTGGADNHLAVDPDTADVVTRIFTRIAAGKTCSVVARELTASGVPTPGKAEAWHPSTVYDIAVRKAYVGRFEYGRQKWVRLNSERDRQRWAQEYTRQHGRPPATIPAKIRVPGEQIYECASPVIIPPALWKAVARRLSKARKGAREARRVPMLLGILRCEECGRDMRATWAKGRGGKEFYFYRCYQAVKDPARFPCRVADREKGLRA